MLADEFKIKFFETSAKENIGVKEAFSYLASEVKTRLLTADGTEEVYRVDAIRLTSDSNREKSLASTCPC